jgi:hypothetical protein
MDGMAKGHGPSGNACRQLSYDLKMAPPLAARLCVEPFADGISREVLPGEFSIHDCDSKLVCAKVPAFDQRDRHRLDPSSRDKQPTASFALQPFAIASVP